ncbi:MAG TPA: hypothetical protein VN837_13330 [Chloroflexota bacterium]|nr:hypothetical protein [Chloroflexota bacterium]
MTRRSGKGLAAWQTRWVALHDELHLLEVLLEAIEPRPEYTTEYWALGADLITLGQDLEETYAMTLAAGGPESDAPYLELRGRLTHLQARAQLLSLEHDLE